MAKLFTFTDLRKRIYSVNAKILNAEKRYGKDSNIVKRVYATINQIYGTEGKVRYSVPKDESGLRHLRNVDRGVSLIENSLYFSKAGRETLRTRQLDTLQSRFGLSDVQAEKLMDVLQNSTDWDRIRELAGEGNSDIYIDAINRAISEGKETEQIIDIMSEYFRREGADIDRDFLDFFYERIYTDN